MNFLRCMVVLSLVFVTNLCARAESLAELSESFWQWRAQEQPFTNDDIPRIDAAGGFCRRLVGENNRRTARSACGLRAEVEGDCTFGRDSGSRAGRLPAAWIGAGAGAVGAGNSAELEAGSTVLCRPDAGIGVHSVAASSSVFGGAAAGDCGAHEADSGDDRDGEAESNRHAAAVCTTGDRCAGSCPGALAADGVGARAGAHGGKSQGA